MSLLASPTSSSAKRWIVPVVIGLLLWLLATTGVLAATFAWCVSGHFRWTVALAGLFGNTTPALVVTALLYLAFRKRPRVLLAALLILFVLQILGTISCTEFMLERGAPMAPIDMKNGMDAGFIATELGILVSRRYGPFLLLAAALFVGAAIALRRIPAPSGFRPRAVVLCVLGVFTAISLWVHTTPRGSHALRPYERLMGALVTTNQLNIIVGLEPALQARPATEEAAGPALAMMGLPVAACPDGLHVGEPLPGNVPPSAAAFQDAFVAVARHLGESGRPLSFTFVLLESVGAEDIHALDGASPDGLTPYFDQLAQGSNHALVVRKLYQAGQRTAGGMSALLCGVGTGPFGLAPLRDLPSLKLRCWPDLAAGTGADLRFFYAENLKFDRYEGSLVDHGFSYLHVPRSEGRPHGSWGLSDKGLFEDILGDLEAQSSRADSRASLRIRGVLTLSTHGPYDTPDDMPTEARDRARSLAAQATSSSTKQAHWVTVSYLDQALSEFVPALIQAEIRAGHTPVLLLVGDHSSGATVGKNHLPAARIAGFWVFPPSIDRGLLDPVQRALDEHSWSQNDLPRMILTLLERSGALRSLAPEARWHSMGGQSLSATFAVPAPWQATRLWIIDTHARSRLLGASDQVLVEAIAESPATRQDLDSSSKPTDMALPGLSWLLQHPERVGPCRAVAPAASSSP